MLRTQKLDLFVLLLAVVLLVALAPTALVAQDDEGMPPAGEVPREVEADVNPPPDFLDGFEELNPVSHETLADLSAREGQESNALTGLSNVSSSTQSSTTFTINSVFQKYIRVSLCPVSGCNVDHLAAGTALRNTGYGTIRLRGVPPTATAVSAFLYVGIIDSTTPPPNPLPVNFNGTTVSAFLVNTAPNPCWGAGTFRAYRAIVLPLLAPGINADYRVSGVPSSITDGRCPWTGAAANPRAEGASLVVLYTDPSVPAGSRVQIHHPLVTTVFGTTTYNHFLTFQMNVGADKHTRLGADGQSGTACPGSTVFNSNERTLFGGPVGTPLVQIRGNPVPLGSNPNVDSDWNGTDGEPLNQLWDTHTSLVGGTITPVVANYRVQYQAPGDCIVPVAHVLTYR